MISSVVYNQAKPCLNQATDAGKIKKHTKLMPKPNTTWTSSRKQDAQTSWLPDCPPAGPRFFFGPPGVPDPLCRGFSQASSAIGGLVGSRRIRLFAIWGRFESSRGRLLAIWSCLVAFPGSTLVRKPIVFQWFSCVFQKHAHRVFNTFPGRPRALLRLFVPILGPSRGSLGALLGLPGALLESLCALLGVSWNPLGPSGGHLGYSWGILGPPGASLRSVGALLDPFWGLWGSSSDQLGDNWG